jgi:CRISPR-associated protein (TIGR03984 family)
MAEVDGFDCAASEIKAVLPDDLLSAVHDYDYVVFYTSDGVRIESAKEVKALPGDYLELRAFSESGEMHVVTYNGGVRGRIRTDSDTGESRVLDEEHLLWGKVISDSDTKTTILAADRGTYIELPMKGPATNKRVTLLVRNYLEADKTKPFMFIDYRFVRFIIREGD